MYKFFKVIFVVFFFFTFTWIEAEEKIRPFQIQSGSITYEIIGGAQLTPETNLTIKGTSQLHFKNWGNIKIEEDGGILFTRGAIKHKQNVRKFVKQTKDNIVTVDYKKEQLTERKRASDKKMNQEIEGLVKIGKSEVAGIECDVWEGVGVSKCIYKGIVLKLESQVYNASYVKQAIKIVFNKSHSHEAFTLPDYPIHKIGLFKDNIKTKNVQKAESVTSVLKNKISASDTKVDLAKNKENQKIQKFLNRLGKDIFRQQKELLPDLLLSMKNTRACLQTAESPFEANRCTEEFSRMKEQLGTEEDDYILLWDKKRKEILLDKIEDELTVLQAQIPCINRAKNITDLSVCIK